MINLAVVLNGPPGVGKDTIAARLYAQPGYRHFKTAQPLHEAAEAFEAEDKDALCALGVTGREFRILLSEQFIKPHFGPAAFGRLLATRIKRASTSSRRWQSDSPHQNLPSVAVISDGGFAAELSTLLPVADRVLVLRLHRGGKTWEGDSRSYLVWTHPHVLYADIYLIEDQVAAGTLDCQDAIDGMLGLS